MKIVPPSIAIEAITPGAARLIERAGRTCYKSEERSGADTAAAFIAGLVKREHLSVLEHASVTFRIICDRGVSHELVRHRIASFSQKSTRYCNYSKAAFRSEITVIEPPDLPEQARYAWLNACQVAEAAYFEMLSAGCAPQIARSVLPTCLETEVVMTANFREWLHFLELRTAPAAHPQMREIATKIQHALQIACPEVFGQRVESEQPALFSEEIHP